MSDFTEDYLNAAAGGPLTEVCGKIFALVLRSAVLTMDFYDVSCFKTNVERSVV